MGLYGKLPERGRKRKNKLSQNTQSIDQKFEGGLGEAIVRESHFREAGKKVSLSVKNR